jgi:hypothetical protein
VLQAEVQVQRMCMAHARRSSAFSKCSMCGPPIKGACRRTMRLHLIPVVGLFDDRSRRLSPMRAPQRVRSDENGHYRIVVRPGTYHVLAVDGLKSSQLYDSEFMRSLNALSRTVVVHDNESVTKDLVVIGK